MATEIKGREVLKVQTIAGVLNYAKGTKMEGKTYRRFAYGGKVFIANTEDTFCTDFDKGNVYSIDLDSDTEGQLSLVGKTTITQEVNMAKTEVMLASFTVENFMAGKITNPEAVIAGIE